VRTAVDESPLLVTVTGKQLLKTMQAAKILVCALVWKISNGAVSNYSHEMCVKVVSKSNLQSKTPWSHSNMSQYFYL
jgi:hypothetical protein